MIKKEEVSDKLLSLVKIADKKKKFISGFLKFLDNQGLKECVFYLKNEKKGCVEKFYLADGKYLKLDSVIEEDCDLKKIFSILSKDKDYWRFEFDGEFLGFIIFKQNKKIKSFDKELIINLVNIILKNFLTKERLDSEREISKTLYQVNIDLSLYLELNNILKKIVESLKKIIDYNAVAIYILDHEKKDLKTLYFKGFPKKNFEKLKVKIGQGLVGLVAKNGKPYISMNVKNEKIYVQAREKTKSEIVVPIISKNKTIGILNLESNKLSQYSKKHLRILNAFASIAAIAIERSNLYRERIEKNKIERELEIAKQIQDRMIPKSFPKHKFYEIYGGTEPAEIVGGDFFDFLRVGDILYFVIADISGKGVPASLLVALFKSAFLIIFKKEKSFEEKVEEINSFVYENTESNQFITAIFGKIDGENIELINCGHNYPLLYRGKRIYTLKKGNTILGFFKNYKYSSFNIKMKPENILFLYTDGLYESIGVLKKEIGLRGVKKYLNKYRDLSLSQIWNHILKDMKKVSNGNLLDDFTILIVKRKK